MNLASRQGKFRTPHSAPRTLQAAFTLVELIISAGVMSLILAAAYACFSSGVASQKLVESRAEVVQTARVAMALMTADLRSACPLSPDVPFLGMNRMLGEVEADNLDFATHHYTPRRAGEGDFCETSYFLDRDPASAQYSLWRRRNPAISPDPLSGGKREEIARGVRGLRFEYFDGFDWYDEWGDVEGRGKAQLSGRLQPNRAGMPEAVRVTLWLDANPRPLRSSVPPALPSEATSGAEAPLVFQTVARLNLAGLSLPGVSEGSAGEGASGSSAQPMTTPSEGGRQ
jgi:type II secretory pathway component PulJ